jgi:hypothetical protein
MEFHYLKKKILMDKSIFVTIIYVLGMVFCALVLKIWNAETSIKEASIALAWTSIYLIALFYANKNEKK